MAKPNFLQAILYCQHNFIANQCSNIYTGAVNVAYVGTKVTHLGTQP